MHYNLLAVCSLSSIAALPLSQDDESTGVLEGHSVHGEAFNEGPRQAAYLMPNPGNVHLPVTSEHPRVQEMFDQGVGQLHGFWYFEAERSFRQVAAWDPECAMAYWGMAVANMENEERAEAFAREAYTRRESASDHERMYIDAWARFYAVAEEESGEAETAEPVAQAQPLEKAEGASTSEPAPAGPPGGHGSGTGLGDGNGSGGRDGKGKQRRLEAERAAAEARAEQEAQELAATEDETDEAAAEGSDPEDPDQEDRDPKVAMRALILDLEKIIRAYPDDIEAKAFLVVVSWYGGYFGLEITSRQALQSMLDEVFEAQPNHPAHHYRIHLWDKEETSEYVVGSAVSSGPSWPSVAHMWHMGGHIFENLGRHRDAAWQQDASARIDHSYMMRDLVLPDQIHNYAHNNEWLVRSLSHVGRVDEALELARNMIELPRHPNWNLPDQRGTSSFWGRQRLAGVFELFELWEELVATAETGYLAAVDYGDEYGDGAIEDAAHRAFALGQAHTYLGNEAERQEQIDRLLALRIEVKAARAEALDAAEEEALGCGADAKGVREAMDGVLDEYARSLDELRDSIEILEALSDVLAAIEVPVTNDVEERLADLEEHGYRETALARLYTGAGLHEKAEELARDSVEDRPGQAEAYATLAHVLEAAGKREEALEAFEQLRAISAELDLDVPTFRRLAPLAEAAGHARDWRSPLSIPDDVGSRPDLASLGPRRWTAPTAPDWSAIDAYGNEHEQADHSGRPRILILFLGFGCTHCVEQLEAFGPAAEKFAEAGIDIVTIGDDPAEELDPDDVADWPFPVLADPEYDVFRAYRCYDDFEDVPLHGTFLIDADDRLRWQDVSFEPFTDTEFLLGEAQRLLGLPIH